MNDLISKKNLIKSIDYIGTPGGIWAKPFEAYKEAFKEFVKGMPSAKPPPETCWGCNCPKMEEPKMGRWRHYEGVLTCLECGAEFYDDIMEYTGDEVPHFCPDCGANMEG